MARPRFSLRWLLALVFIVAVYLGGFASGRLLYVQRERQLQVETQAMRSLMHAQRLRAEQAERRAVRLETGVQQGLRYSNTPSAD